MNFIVVVEENWGIGNKGKLLFSLPPDMKNFREKTLDKVVVMGEATLLSLPEGKPLKRRTNIVLSDNPKFSCEGAEVCRKMTELFSAISKYNHDEVFIIGGASVYNQLMDCCNMAYITKVQSSVVHDAAISPLDGRAGWKLIEQSQIQEHEGLKFTFNIYENSIVKNFPADR